MGFLGFHDRRGVRRLTSLVVALMVPAACAGGGQQTSSSASSSASVAAERTAAASSSPFGSYLAGRFAERSRDVGAAARYLSRSLAADPQNARLRRRTFLLHLGSGQVDEAITLAKQSVESGENTPVAGVLLAVAAAKEGRFPEADQRLSALPRRGGNEILVPLLLSWVRFGEGDPDAALKALAPLGSVKGFGGFYDLHRAALLDLAGRNDEAEKYYTHALKSAVRPSLRLVAALASFYQRTGRSEEGRRLISGFLKQAPDSLSARAIGEALETGKTLPRLIASPTSGMAEALFNVASALYQENVAQTALIYARMAVYLRPDFPVGQLLVANVLEVNGRRKEAIAAYRRIRPDSPLAWEARLAVARNLDELDRVDEATRLLRQMADERPDRPDALIALGDLYRAREKYEDAVKAYDGAMARIPEIRERHWGLFYARGIALERSKQWKRAEADFLRALELEPDQPYVLNYLGYSWVEQGIHLKRARKMLEKAVSLRRDDGYITDSLGWALYRTGAFENAVRHLERAVELLPQDSTINDHLGDAYWMVGRQAEARFQWRRALSLGPDPEVVPVIESKLERGLDKDGTAPRGQ